MPILKIEKKVTNAGDAQNKLREIIQDLGYGKKGGKGWKMLENGESKVIEPETTAQKPQNEPGSTGSSDAIQTPGTTDAAQEGDIKTSGTNGGSKVVPPWEQNGKK